MKLDKYFGWGNKQDKIAFIDERNFERTRNVKPVKKYPCKKLKGEHDFFLVNTMQAGWMNGIYSQYECRACGKKDFMFSPNTSSLL